MCLSFIYLGPILSCVDLFLGDIKVQEGVEEKEISGVSSVVDRRRLWPDNTVYYIIDEPSYSELSHVCRNKWKSTEKKNESVKFARVREASW